MLWSDIFHMNEQIFEFLLEFLLLCWDISSSYSASLDLKGDKKTRAIRNLVKCYAKVGRVFLMVVVSMLPHSEIGRNDHQEHAPHFSNLFYESLSFLLN